MSNQRSALFHALPVLVALACGCAGTQVKVSDGIVETPLLEATGVTSEAVTIAREKTALGLWDVYALAVERTERLAFKYENIEQARSHRQQAIGSFLPQVSLKYSKSFLDLENGVGDSSSFYLHGRQALLTGLNEVAALKGAGAEKRMRISELRHDSGRLLLDVARAFYTAVQAEEALRSEQSILELNGKMLKQQRVFRAQGRIRVSDLLGTEAQLARTEAEIATLEDLLQQARETLAELAGVDPDRSLSADDPEGFPEFNIAVDEAVKKATTRWDVRAAYEALQLAKAQELAATGARLPSLALEGNYYLDREGTSSAGKWDALVMAELPLFNLAGLEGKSRESRSKKRQARLALSQNLRSARQEIRTAFVAYQNALKRDAAYQKALDAAEKSHKALASDYQLRLMDQVEYLRSVSDLEQARLNRAKSRTQWRLQRVWLGVAVNEFPVIKPSDDGKAATQEGTAP